MRQRPSSPRLATVLVAVALSLTVGGEAARYVEDAEAFPGWKGELPNASKSLAAQANETNQPVLNVGYAGSGEVGVGSWEGGARPMAGAAPG